MEDQDTGSNDAASAASKTSEVELTPLQVLDGKAEEAYKTLKETGSLPADTPVEVEALAKSKKVARDTQSGFTKSRQELAALKAENTVLQGEAQQAGPVLTDEQASELEELKFSDPDEWRRKANEYETQAKQSRETKIAETRAAMTVEERKAERVEQLKTFTAETGITLDDDVLANDIPPRITKQLEDGKIDFKEFLNQAAGFLKADKVVANSGSTDTAPGFDDVSGSATADNKSTQTDFVQEYANNKLEY